MIRFFRKIRQRLLTENKLSKYLLYAAGEILLVMIGILLALQVNNWNEKRKTKAIELDYLIALEEEFEFNLEAIEKSMKLCNSNIINALSLFDYFTPNEVSIDDNEFIKLLGGSIFNEIQLRHSEGVLNEMVSSGKLGLISNAKLKKQLAAWSGKIVKVRFQEEEHSRYRYLISEFVEKNSNMREFVISYYSNAVFDISPSNFTTNNLKLLKSEILENYFIGFYGTGKLLNQNYYKNLKDDTNDILRLIKESKND